MNKLYIILLCMFTLTPLSVAAADMEDGGVETELEALQLTVNGTQVRVCGGAGQQLEIYDLAGIRVSIIKIDSDDKTFQLHMQRGCYFVKIGKLVRKVSIR